VLSRPCRPSPTWRTASEREHRQERSAPSLDQGGVGRRGAGRGARERERARDSEGARERERERERARERERESEGERARERERARESERERERARESARERERARESARERESETAAPAACDRPPSLVAQQNPLTIPPIQYNSSHLVPLLVHPAAHGRR
jgi:hypothetical protein